MSRVFLFGVALCFLLPLFSLPLNAQEVPVTQRQVASWIENGYVAPSSDNTFWLPTEEFQEIGSPWVPLEESECVIDVSTVPYFQDGDGAQRIDFTCRLVFLMCSDVEPVFLWEVLPTYQPYWIVEEEVQALIVAILEETREPMDYVFE